MGESIKGSSPLARGLRVSKILTATLWGIIPARAGFTVRPRRVGRMESDHPRSRGVYGGAAASALMGGGSSPLARGLPWTISSRKYQYRIIPARAGFTAQSSNLPSFRADHPRSRGVYRVLVNGLLAADGSSPLARGLLDVVATVLEAVRIIPARAGFTHYPRLR